MKKILITWCLLLALLPVLEGCSGTTAAGKVKPEMAGLSLDDIWTKVAAAADLQAQSAELGTFNLQSTANGSIQSLYFDFTGYDRKGHPRVYLVDMDHTGKLTVRSSPTDMVIPQQHPSVVFEAIDALGVGSLQPGPGGLTLHIDFLSGGVRYSHNSMDLYELAGGKLRTIKDIAFQTAQPWCTISVFRQAAPTGNTSATTTVTVPASPGTRTSQMWLIPQDVARASDVEYLGPAS